MAQKWATVNTTNVLTPIFDIALNVLSVFMCVHLKFFILRFVIYGLVIINPYQSQRMSGNASMSVLLAGILSP